MAEVSSHSSGRSRLRSGLGSGPGPRARVSTRPVDDLVQALGVDAGISKSEVSRICAQLDEAVSAFRTRTLSHTGLPYVYLDETYPHVRETARACPPDQVVSKAIHVGRTAMLDMGDMV